MMHFRSSLPFFCVQLGLSLVCHLSSGLPNQIRVHSNSENLSSAPYLLDATRQVEAGPNNGSFDSRSNLEAPNAPAAAKTAQDLQEPAAASVIAREYLIEGTPTSESSSHFSALDEEKSASEQTASVADENSPQASVDSGDSAPAEQASVSSADEPAAVSANESQPAPDSKPAGELERPAAVEGAPPAKPESRKPQLPVTSSHLKRPAQGVPGTAEGAAREDSSSALEEPSGKPGAGAKSLVSPSVSLDSDAPSGAEANRAKQKWRQPAPIPDTLEPSQIMSLPANGSGAVPAIVSREYGHHTRTRITLGGGYVRDRLPPAAPGLSESDGGRLPDRSPAVLEKPKLKAAKESARLPAPAKLAVVAQIVEVTSGEPVKMRRPAPADADDSSAQPASVAAPAAVSKAPAAGAPAKTRDNRCPAKGIATFEHPTACDRYYFCEHGLAREMVCPNGLMYGVRDVELDYCVHRWKADCQDKRIPNPISSPGCRWQYGLFNVQGSPRCSPDYYECREGHFQVRKCSLDGQVFDDRSKSCLFAEQVGCIDELLADFTCPIDDQSNTYWPFPRYFFNERALIHCINDKPQIVRCTENERVDPEHLHCVPMAKVNLAQHIPASILEEGQQQQQPQLSESDKKNRKKKKVGLE